MKRARKTTIASSASVRAVVQPAWRFGSWKSSSARQAGAQLPSIWLAARGHAAPKAFVPASHVDDVKTCGEYPGVKVVEHVYFYAVHGADEATIKGYLERAYRLGREF
jgi:hypothetical protein